MKKCCKDTLAKVLNIIKECVDDSKYLRDLENDPLRKKELNGEFLGCILVQQKVEHMLEGEEK